MSISVTCACGRRFEISDVTAGDRSRCPDCGRELTVPEPMPPAEDEFLPWEPVATVTSGKAVVSLALGVVFFFACLTGLPAILVGCHALSDINLSKGRLRGRWMAVAGIGLGVIGCLFTVALLLPAVCSAREAARRSQCVCNLAQIGLALHNYHEANGCLPPAAITDRNGRRLLSWRVAVLPYLECGPLYSQFHLDEPWDSPHNLTFLDHVPSVYACPSDVTRKPGTTGTVAVIGPSTAFTPDFKPVPLLDFTDGTSHTILVGESRHCIPWTKPDDLPFDMSVPLSGLGSYHSNGFNALLADGSVRFVKSSIAPGILAALLTRNGNEVISPGSF